MDQVVKELSFKGFLLSSGDHFFCNREQFEKCGKKIHMLWLFSFVHAAYQALVIIIYFSSYNCYFKEMYYFYQALEVIKTYLYLDFPFGPLSLGNSEFLKVHILL
jgi:hypothetical protein